MLGRPKAYDVIQSPNGIRNTTSREIKHGHQQKANELWNRIQARQAGQISKRTLSPAQLPVLSEAHNVDPVLRAIFMEIIAGARIHTVVARARIQLHCFQMARQLLGTTSVQVQCVPSDIAS